MLQTSSAHRLSRKLRLLAHLFPADLVGIELILDDAIRHRTRAHDRALAQRLSVRRLSSHDRLRVHASRVC